MADTAPVPLVSLFTEVDGNWHCNENLLQLQLSLQACLDCFRPLFPRRDQAASFAA